MTHARIGKKFPPSFSLDVEFEIGEGVTGIYGETGSGKTVILQALAGFILPDSGRILRDDVLLFDAEARVDVPARRRNCGYIPQGDTLFPHMTVRQNLGFAARGARLERYRRIAEMLERFGLSDAALRRPGGLDPSQKPRATLARALIAHPALLLLDDPDWPGGLFRQLRAEFAGPVLLATRDLDRCCLLADRMLVLEGGRVLQRGSPAEVLDQPESVAVARLVGIPNVFECTIAGLDPGRNSSRLELDLASGRQVLTGPYFPGHFRGDRVWIAIRPERVRAHATGTEGIVNGLGAQLVRASHLARCVRLEFAGGIFADLSREDYERQKDNRGWQVEFPPAALRVL
ncbi:MAG: ATP-binding cassette domain-containing protein [Acidobacteriia bacterium]|nr:ATP-binding cassette domain-containing protein [Terriglobia bacterium]